MGFSKIIEQIDPILMGAITIKQAKKCVEQRGKKFKIGFLKMFYHLKSLQLWQVVPFSFI